MRGILSGLLIFVLLIPAAAAAPCTGVDALYGLDAAAVYGFSVPPDEAAELAQLSLWQSGGVELVDFSLRTQDGRPVYAVVLLDNIGDAHLRLVDAMSGAVGVQSLWTAD